MLRRIRIAIVDGIGQGRDGVDGLVLEAPDRPFGHVGHGHGQRDNDHKEGIDGVNARGDDADRALGNLGQDGGPHVRLPRGDHIGRCLYGDHRRDEGPIERDIQQRHEHAAR